LLETSNVVTDEPLPKTLSFTLAVAIAAVVAASAASAAAQNDAPADPLPAEGETIEADEEPALDPVPPQTVYLLAVPTSADLESIAARVGAASRGALRRVPGAQWEAPDKAFLGYTDFMLERLRRGRDRLIEGRQAYLNLELERAIELLSGAVEDFDVAAAATEDPQDLGEALLYLGASQTFAGQTRATRRTFQRLHQQMPHIEPDPNIFNPDVVRRYEASAPRDADSPAASVQIESEPPGAIAYVDFVPRGRTPLTVDGLMGGIHTVRVTRPGATPFVQQVDIGSREAGQVNAFLEDNEATAGLAEQVQALAVETTDEMESGTAIADIATVLALDKIGIIRVSSARGEGNVELELLMYDVGSGRRILRAHGPAPAQLGALESAVQELVASGLDVALRHREAQETGEDTEVIPAFRERTGAEEPPGEGSILSEWWFWGGIGVAVALGVVLTIVLTSGSDDVGQNTGGQVILQF
jgi:hypothetical protein